MLIKIALSSFLCDYPLEIFWIAYNSLVLEEITQWNFELVYSKMAAYTKLLISRFSGLVVGANEHAANHLTEYCIITPPPERGNVIACVCPSVCVQDYAKSNARISLKFCRLIRNYRRTNPLNLGYDLDLIRDLRSGSNFQTVISRKIISGFLWTFVGWTSPTTGRTY